jgi:hypothetical protein
VKNVRRRRMTIKSTDCIGLDKKAKIKHNKTNLYYKGKWILRTTETGIEMNGKVTWYRVVWAYTLYVWYTTMNWLTADKGI